MKDVLLFYKDYERDSFFPYDRYIKRYLRPLTHRFKRGQKVTGFEMWYRLLVKALQIQGVNVIANDYNFAKRNSDYPVGILGYPDILNNWSLENPAILGPGLFDHPRLAPKLMEDSRFKLYITTCDWMQKMFVPYYGERCVLWHAGIDLQEWPDTRKDNIKSNDVLVYDKIRWNREHYASALLEPIRNYLDSQKRSHVTIRYKHYDHETYRSLLSQSKIMIFLCEHETQGMAYQEALASNVPILAWENGFWLDPNRPRFEPEPVQATSVPYFSSECGERFRDFGEFCKKFDVFWARRNSYQPRDYIRRELSLTKSAKVYLEYYQKIS